MKRILSLIIFLSVLVSPSYADKNDINDAGCDLCACYLGIDPNHNMHTIGFRFSQFVFSRVAGSTINTETDHPDHGGSHSDIETYSNYEIFGRYYFSPKFRVSFNFPFSSNDISGKTIKDISDASIIAQYQLFNTYVDGDTKFRQRMFTGGGLKLPFGSYNKSLEPGVLDPHIQAGTGSLDFLLSTSYLAWLSGLGFNTDIIYTINTANKNNYRFANRLNITSSLFYKLTQGNFWSFLPHSGIYLESAGNDFQNGLEMAGTKSSALFLTGGLDVYYKQFSINFTYKHPVSQSFDTPDQPQNDRRFFIGAGFSFE